MKFNFKTIDLLCKIENCFPVSPVKVHIGKKETDASVDFEDMCQKVS
jgi:hypothetical protein